MKISIIGHCGSGKSTLARCISEKKRIPRLELDRLFFENGGQEAKLPDEKQQVKDKIKTQVMDFMRQHDHWVTDGVYLTSVQPVLAEAADYLVIIDIPLYRRMINHLKRWWQNKERHQEVSRLQDLLFTFDMIRRTRNSEPKIQQLKSDFQSKVIVLSNYQAVSAFLDTI